MNLASQWTILRSFQLPIFDPILHFLISLLILPNFLSNYTHMLLLFCLSHLSSFFFLLLRFFSRNKGDDSIHSIMLSFAGLFYAAQTSRLGRLLRLNVFFSS